MTLTITKVARKMYLCMQKLSYSITTVRKHPEKYGVKHFIKFGDYNIGRDGDQRARNSEYVDKIDAALFLVQFYKNALRKFV